MNTILAITAAVFILLGISILAKSSRLFGKLMISLAIGVALSSSINAVNDYVNNYNSIEQVKQSLEESTQSVDLFALVSNLGTVFENLWVRFLNNEKLVTATCNGHNVRICTYMLTGPPYLNTS